MNGVIHQGHILEVLKEMEPESVQCVITSPQLGRKWVIIDLSEKYCEMAKKRILTKAWGPQEENQANWVQNDLELKTGDDE